jgi:hypothetical protein
MSAEINAPNPQPTVAGAHTGWLDRLVLRFRVWMGYREWVTLNEWQHNATMHHIDGTISHTPCRWRDQLCRVSGHVRRQSNWGQDWTTEDES